MGAVSCLLIGGVRLLLTSPAFTLEWEHSVEHQIWRESWMVDGGALILNQAAVKGSGAGMEPGDGAWRENGFWIWTPHLPPQEKIVLAASGATSGGGWRLCGGQTGCVTLGAKPDRPVAVTPCPSP